MAVQERNSEMVSLLSADFIQKQDSAYLAGIVTGTILSLPGLVAFWPGGISVSDSDDLYANYAYLPGRLGGQTLIGGTAAGDAYNSCYIRGFVHFCVYTSSFSSL